MITYKCTHWMIPGHRYINFLIEGSDSEGCMSIFKEDNRSQRQMKRLKSGCNCLNVPFPLRGFKDYSLLFGCDCGNGEARSRQTCFHTMGDKDLHSFFLTNSSRSLFQFIDKCIYRLVKAEEKRNLNCLSEP